MEANLDNPFILLRDKTISHLREVLPILEKTSETGKPLLIIAPNVDGEALQALVVNKVKGGLKVAAVESPGFGNLAKSKLEDIAITTGGTVISDNSGIQLEMCELTHLGQAEKAVITKDSTTIVNGAGNTSDILKRAENLRDLIKDETSDQEKEILKERLAK